MRNLVYCLYALLAFLLLTACSSEMELITKDSVTSRQNTLVVMGIKWIDTYNDPKDHSMNTIASYQLLQDEKRIKEKLTSEGAPLLRERLYYLSHFKYYFEEADGKERMIEHFARNMNAYEPTVIYQFKPGKLTLNTISTRHQVFGRKRSVKESELKKEVKTDYSLDFGSWQLPQGKIVYLGDLTLHFKTKRFLHGIIQEQELNRKVSLMKITLEDNFEAVRAALKEDKPWFPVDQVENIAFAGEWIINPKAIDELQADREAAAKKVTPESKSEKEETEKQKSEDSFF